MFGILRSALLTVLALGISAAPAAAQYPDEPGDGIADRAGVLTAADADSIRATLYRLRQTPGVEVRVLTVRSVAEYRTGAATPEAFATGVYNAWKLGYGQNQDGVLVMLSLDDRFTRIELGDGVPADKDAQVRAIVDNVMVPRFRDGDMSGGLRDGVLAVAGAFGTSPATTGAGVDPRGAAGTQALPVYTPPADPNGAYDSAPRTKATPFALALAGVAGVLGWLVMLRGRKRNCPTCKTEMTPLDEQADDVHLDSGRRLEEVLGSVNYTVWRCASCAHHEIERSARWFSGKETCPQCSYKTVNVERQTLQWATYDRGGQQRVEKNCAHCQWHDVDIVHTPRKTRPSSSSGSSSWRSGSSGSSFGGGSSGSRGGSSSGRGSSGRW